MSGRIAVVIYPPLIDAASSCVLRDDLLVMITFLQALM